MASSNSNSNDSNVSRIVNHIVRPLRPVHDNRIINHRPLYYPRPVFVSPKNINYSLDGRPVWTKENEDWLQDTWTKEDNELAGRYVLGPAGKAERGL